jgi:hypothetical protein
MNPCDEFRRPMERTIIPSELAVCNTRTPHVQTAPVPAEAIASGARRCLVAARTARAEQKN